MKSVILKNFSLHTIKNSLVTKREDVPNISLNINIRRANVKKKKVFKAKSAVFYSYSIAALNKYSMYYKLRRKYLNSYFKLIKTKNLFKLKIKLKKLKFQSILSAVFIKASVVSSAFKDTLISPSLMPPLKYILIITVHANNIFLNIAKNINNKIKTLHFWSAGMFDFVCSKRKLKFAISAMLKELKDDVTHFKFYVTKIMAPKYLNRHIFRQLCKFKYFSRFYIYSSFKIFNGCRSKKKRRKKRIPFRFYR